MITVLETTAKGTINITTATDITWNLKSWIPFPCGANNLLQVNSNYGWVESAKKKLINWKHHLMSKKLQLWAETRKGLGVTTLLSSPFKNVKSVSSLNLLFVRSVRFCFDSVNQKWFIMLQHDISICNNSWKNTNAYISLFVRQECSFYLFASNYTTLVPQERQRAGFISLYNQWNTGSVPTVQTTRNHPPTHLTSWTHTHTNSSE